MRKVERFEADDGSLFATEQDCKEYEFRRVMEQRIYDELRHEGADEIYVWIINNTKGFKDAP